LETAALRIAHGKLLNAGQTCIAPDYVLLPRGREDAFAAAWQRAVTRLFPHLADGNADYAAIVTASHFARLQALLAEAREQGARVEQAPSTPANDAARQMAPALVFGAQAGQRLLQEEIFGPVLPVVPCDSAEEAVRFINARPRPLALYWFGTDTAARDRVLAETVSGGVTLNDTLLHIAHDNLPFGGVGESGMGSYHGEGGFLRFTQQKAVLVQSRWSGGAMLYPPYGARFVRMMGLLRRLG
ncbi:MAG: aldehyde dehydrogenase family protein, partial [Comamonadaceae bacterium]